MAESQPCRCQRDDCSSSKAMISFSDVPQCKLVEVLSHPILSLAKP